MLHNPCCSSFRSVVSWKLETFYFSFSTFICTHFMNQFLGQHCPLFWTAFFPWEFSYDFTQWIQETVITCSQSLLLPRWWLPAFESYCLSIVLETLLLWTHRKAQLCAHAVMLQTSEDTSVLLSRRTNYLLSFKNLLLRFNAWSPDDSFVSFFPSFQAQLCIT